MKSLLSMLISFLFAISVFAQGGDLNIRQYLMDHQDLPDKQLEQKVTELMESSVEEGDGIHAVGMTIVHAPDSSFTLFNLY